MTTPRPVTGHDGDNPITDVQIRELYRDRTDFELADALEIERAFQSIERPHPFAMRARSHCAAIWRAHCNARHAGKETP